MEDSVIIWFVSVVIGVPLLILFYCIWSNQNEDKNLERRWAEENWKLPGQWGARTTAQKDILAELKEWKDNLILYPGYSKNDLLPDKYFKKLEKAKKKIQEHNLDPRLLTELARAVHSYYTRLRAWDLAAQLAQRYNL